MLAGYVVKDGRYKIILRDGNTVSFAGVVYPSDREAECAAFNWIMGQCVHPFGLGGPPITSGTIRVYGVPPAR